MYKFAEDRTGFLIKDLFKGITQVKKYRNYHLRNHPFLTLKFLLCLSHIKYQTVPYGEFNNSPVACNNRLTELRSL